MSSNFDEVIDRRNTSAYKLRDCKDSNTVALGLADMDFRTAEPVVKAVTNAANFSLYGYVQPAGDYFDSFIEWSKKHYRWDIEREWISYTPGVIAGIGGAVRVLTEPGDEVIFQTPAFSLFTELTASNGRVPAHNPMLYRDGKYSIDFDDLEVKAQSPRAKMLILCNPHNPTCRVLTEDELLRIGEICLRNNIVIVSDEVHCDMIFGNRKHISIASLSDALLQNTITCMSPTKTFNMAGLQISVNVIANPELRKKFELDCLSRDSKRPNIFGMIGFAAAYKEGHQWLDEVRTYIRSNIDFAECYLQEHAPLLKMIDCEGTYLMWIDCSALGLKGKALGDFFINEANVLVVSGNGFVDNADAFIRLNPACPRSVLTEGLKRICAAVKGKMNQIQG